MAGRKKGSQTLTPLELQIMQILWQFGPGNVQEVQERLEAESKLAYTTVQTMLNVLYRKGKVKRILHGRAYTYKAVLTKEKALHQVLHDLVDRMFGGSPEEMVMSLMKSHQIDPERIAELSRFIEAKSEGDPNE
jgi:BlaI family transcriptional regulator, penicillinase repressor